MQPNLQTAEQVCKLFQQWDVTESLPKRGQQVVVNVPPATGQHPLAAIKLAGVKNTYNKPLYLIEFLDSLPAPSDLRARVQDWAQEAALADLQFSGDAPWRNVPPEQRKLLEAALVCYARSAAARTFDSLKLHGYLKPENI